MTTSIRTIGIFLVLLIVVFTHAASANDTAAMYFMPDSGSCAVGEEITVELRTDTYSENTMGIQAELGFDPEIVNITNVDFTGYPWQPLSGDGWSNQGDRIILAGLVDPGAPPGTYDVATLTIEGLSAGTTYIELLYSEPTGNRYNLTFVVTEPAYTTAIIADHTCTDLSQIPDEWIVKAKDMFNLSYGHTSHGSQIVTGMTMLKGDQGSLYWFDRIGSGNGMSVWDTTPSGDLGNPDRTAWAAKTRVMLDDPYNIRNAVMWSWCSQADTTEENIQTYLDLMSGLEADYPDVTFIYMTGHLEGTGAEGNLNQRNNQIRDHCIEHNAVLFDFADIESYDPDGDTNFMALNANDNCNYDGGNWADEWCAENTGSVLCDTCDCAHSKPLNCNQKGRAFWWMMARMAGWDGETPVEPDPDPITTVSIGNVTGTAFCQILVKNASNIGAVDLTLNFNSSVMTVDCVLASHMDNIYVNLDHVDEGWVRIGAIQIASTGISGDFVFANLSIVGAGNGSCDLDLTVNSLTDETPNCTEIEYVVENGVYTSVLNGDVNEDGIVDLYDAVYLIKHVIGVEGYEEINEWAADVNDDGVATAADAMYLAKHVMCIAGYEYLK